MITEAIIGVFIIVGIVIVYLFVSRNKKAIEQDDDEQATGLPIPPKKLK